MDLFSFWIFLLLLLKVTEVTTEQHNKHFFGPKGKKASDKGRSPPQEHKVGPRSKPYLVVFLKVVSNLRRRMAYGGLPSHQHCPLPLTLVVAFSDSFSIVFKKADTNADITEE